MVEHLVAPHGGKLVNPMVTPDRAKELKELSLKAASWTLTPRQACDLELLLNGGFSPLDGFLGRKDYEGVCASMRLADGTLWPIPITLDVPEEMAGKLQPGQLLFLRDLEGVAIAAMHVSEVWQPDRAQEAQQVYGTTNPEHPAVAHLLKRSNPVYVGGKVEGLQLPAHYDFVPMRQTPAELRERFAALGWRKIVAFQTRNPLHRAHVEITFRAASQLEANLLIHPVVGMTKPGDVDHYTRVRCYRAALRHYPRNTAMLSLLPLAIRMGSPREAVWHAIIRKNYGCTHLIVGRDHAGPGKDSTGKPFYGPYNAQELIQTHEAELGITAVPFKAMLYVEDLDRYLPEDEVPTGAHTRDISGTELRDRLMDGRDIPAWFSFPEVIAELRRTHPARSKQGFTVFFTGLPSSGKSTLANVLLVKLLEIGGRPVTLLDGDIVRTHLSSELGFSKEHRDLNIRRIGFVASEITKNGGMALCAPIAPYDATRKDVHAAIEAGGGFILVHVATPVEICEQRDRKGLYAKARAGIVKEFTGISDPYEVPQDADLAIDTTDITPDEGAQTILLHLEKKGYIAQSSQALREALEARLLPKQEVDRPIFIMAPHRSGTTLLYDLLGRHPELGYLSVANCRFPASPRLAHVLTRFGVLDRPREAQVVWDRFWTTDDDRMEAKDATPQAIAWHRGLVATVLRLRRTPRFIAKYPRLSLRVPWINAVFPDALFLHIVRDWRAVVNSTLNRHTKRERRTSGKWYRMHIPGWREMSGKSWDVVAGRQYRIANQAIEAQAPLYPGRFLTIRYGTLCAEPVATLRSITDAFGLSWTAEFEKGIDTNLKSANYKWRETLPADSIERIRAEDPAFYAQHEEEA